jgi:calcium-dependent protein kinase
LETRSTTADEPNGVLYQAKRNDAQEPVSVKVICKIGSPWLINISIKKEASLMRRTNHPNVVRLIDFFDEEDYAYIVTEVMKGVNLAQYMSGKSSYHEESIRRIAKAALEAIQHCHKKDIIHRYTCP